jgi:FlaA1/EpsC-like NDP-sugar epimerase
MFLRRYWIPILLFLHDAAIVSVVPFIGLFIRFEGDVDPSYFDLLAPFLPFMLIVRLVTFYFFRLYHRMWRYASIHEMLAIIGAVSVSSAVITGIMLYLKAGVPRSIHLLSWLMLIAFIGFSRLGLRIYYYFRIRMMNPSVNTLIIGAGDAGAMLAKEIRNRWSETRRVVGFIDDDAKKWGQQLMGIPVLGGRDDLVRLAASHKVAEIMIAVPSASGAIIRTLVTQCRETGCTVKILPGLSDLIDGRVSLQSLRNVDLEDLLRRDPVKLDMDAISNYLKGKRIMVTGAGGSIGSEICRQIARFEPEALFLLGKGENSIYDIEQELRQHHPHIGIEPIIADVRDAERINHIFATVLPQVVFHAAAHKHLPLMELQPAEAVRNNVFGTKVVAEAADSVGVETFIMISTDKAVNPTSVMGATKRVAELVVQCLSQQSKTRFAAVRFGNVLGSRGSVVPLFKKQIAAGGPLTITDPEMKRYFMTIPEASQLVLQAGALAKGGEVFVLDMGEPVRILDMAEDLIRLSGYEPYRDIEITFTRVRRGEKLFEELLTAEEGTRATQHEKIFAANLRQVDCARLSRQLEELLPMLESDQIKDVIASMVPTYKPSE